MHSRMLPVLATLCGVVLMAGCGTTTAAASHEVLAQAQHADLQEAKFTIHMTTNTFHAVGTGLLTITPRLFSLTLQQTSTLVDNTTALEVIGEGVDTGCTILDKVANDYRWEIANDGDDFPVNYDTNILNYDHLTHVTVLGTEQKDAQMAQHVRGKFATSLYTVAGNVVPATGDEDLWVRVSDGFPIAIEKTMTADGTPQVTLQVAYIFTAWNTGGSIAVPPPQDIINA